MGCRMKNLLAHLTEEKWNREKVTIVIITSRHSLRVMYTSVSLSKNKLYLQNIFPSRASPVSCLLTYSDILVRRGDTTGHNTLPNVVRREALDCHLLLLPSEVGNCISDDSGEKRCGMPAWKMVWKEGLSFVDDNWPFFSCWQHISVR